jgi:hypothetical protein
MRRRPLQDAAQLQLVPTRPLPAYKGYQLTEADVRRLYSRIGSIDGENCRWSGWYKQRSGHAKFRINGKTALVHRLVYLLEVGEIPEGYDVHHRCHKPGCCNAAHLELLTRSEHRRLHLIESNGGSGAAIKRGRTHCQRCGHAFVQWKDFTDKRGYKRQCRACNTEQKRASRLRRRQQLLLTTTAP